MNFIDEEAEVPRGKGTFPSHRLESKAKMQTLIMPASDPGSGLLCNSPLCSPNKGMSPGLWVELEAEPSMCQPT